MMKRVLKSWAGAGLACALLSLSSQAEAHILSTKATGMAGATVAYAQDSMVPVYNPALALRVCDRWDLGVNARYWKKDVTIRDENFKSSRTYVAFPEFGYNYVCNCDWAFGLSVYNYDYLKTHFKTPLSDFGTSHARFDYHVEAIQLRLAHRINNCHTFGASFDIYLGRFRLDGFENFDVAGTTIGTTSVAGHVTNNGYDYTNGYSFTLGWLWNVNRCLDFGISYSHEVAMRQLDRYKGFLAEHSIDIPSIMRVGAAYHYNCDFVLALDFEYRWWNDIHALHNLFPGSGPGGTRDGWGFHWREQWMLKVGAEYNFSNCLTARVGYRYEKTPWRDRAASTYLNALTINTVEHYFTWGFSYDLDRCSEFSFVNEIGFKNKLRGTIPAVTTPTIAAGNFHAEECNFIIGLSYGKRF